VKKELIKIYVVLTMVSILGLLVDTAAAGPAFQGFETDTGDWVFDDGGAVSGRIASGGGLLDVTSVSGGYHCELANVHDLYQGDYGTAGYIFFGGRDSVYQGPFYQGVDVYIDPTWSGLGFWIDISPADVDNTSLYTAEGNFRLTADGTSVAVQAINGSTLTKVTNADWCSFEMVWSKGVNPTDLINIDLNVYDSSCTLLGSELFLATVAQGTHPGQSQYLGNSSYVW
jgi:hypothetical protein